MVQFGLAEGEGVAMLIIRRASPEDCEGILAAHVASIRELCARDYSPEQIEAWAGPKRAEVYLSVMTRHTFVVAERDGEILGFGEMSVHPEGGLAPGVAEICGLYVHPAHGRCGVGRAIVDHLRDEALRRGAVRWKVRSTVTAESFYQRVGFCTIERGTHPLGRLELPCIFMVGELPRAGPT